MTFHLRKEPQIVQGILESSDAITCRHLKSARVRRSEELRLVFQGKVYTCNLIELGRASFRAKVTACGEVIPREPRLYFALSTLSGTKLSEVVFALSQLAVDEFWIFGARRSEKSSLQPRLLQRLTEISIRACEISDLLHLPTLRILTDVHEVIRQVKGIPGESVRKLLFYEELTERSVPISAFLRQPYDRSKLLAVIGPEGGFEEDEVQAFTAAGFELLSLGNIILDSRVAAYYACSALRLWIGGLEDSPDSPLKG